MDGEPPSKAVEEDTPQSTQEGNSSPIVDNPPSNQIDRDFLKEKPSPSEAEDEEEAIDESRDTASRTSTRLVKFQLFETKTVTLRLNCTDASDSISSDPIRMKRIIEY